MLLKKEKPFFVLPERIDDRNCQLALYNDGDPEKNPQSVLYMVMRVDIQEFRSMACDERKREILGVPSFYAVEHGDHHDQILLWPVPVGDIHACFDYCPARKRL